jgi:hypothetical protein
MKLGGETIFVKQDGWDLLEVFDEVTQSLDQILRDQKEEHEKKPRHGRPKKNPYASRGRNLGYLN